MCMFIKQIFFFYFVFFFFALLYVSVPGCKITNLYMFIIFFSINFLHCQYHCTSFHVVII